MPEPGASSVTSAALTHWVDYIQTLHPRSIDLSLERVAQAWGRFRPEQLPTVIAIAGTNGKGSSVSMLESVYRQAGYRTGSFTSPHLVRFNERICLNNVPVSDQRLLDAFEKIEQIRGDISLTFFEFNTLLALDIFCAEAVDVMLLEVGMGGRLDAVNIVDNDLALITAIGLDHCAWLGEDLESIGAEKAGIIKEEGLAVIADPNAPDSIIRRAKQQQARYVRAVKDYQLEHCLDDRVIYHAGKDQPSGFSNIALPKAALHQYHNMAGVIATVSLLQHKLPVSLEQLDSGLEQQFLAGRLQLLETQPPLLLDVSHNDASVMAMLDHIDNMQVPGQIHAVFGALADKRYEQAFDALKLRVSAWYLSSIEGERGQTAQRLGEQLFSVEERQSPLLDLGYFEQPVLALERARAVADKQDLIVIFGSFHIVGAIIAALDL